jgi:hypothetical protein
MNRWRTLLGVLDRCAFRGRTGIAAGCCTDRRTRVSGGAGGNDVAALRSIVVELLRLITSLMVCSTQTTVKIVHKECRSNLGARYPVA